MSKHYKTRDEAGRFMNSNDRYMHAHDRYVRTGWEEDDQYYSASRAQRQDYDAAGQGTARQSPYLTYGRPGHGRWVDVDSD